MSLQCSRRLLAIRPPDEAPFRQPFLCEPKSLPVVDQNANRRAAPAPKQKQTTGERIGLEFLFAQPRQRIDALPAIDRFNGNKDLHLWCDLNHACSHKIRLSWARSAAVIPFIECAPFHAALPTRSRTLK